MKKNKILADTYDITKYLYYDQSLYEHDHKKTHTKDIVTTVQLNFKERENRAATMIMDNGILYN